ncbi:GumC family protein [Parerythrobacter jejuensis]|uniref:Polysaccharide biosynthesis tyrosine autokinase n=1 Tax=Parerythrobacter jejuensis TaxID=795812 RepID=A0A845AZD3_9SPHN|nr:polysaccharide biosynthesis tyrosine autokinase [Parerythrobacter jejuensis]MXP31106.1 polysaccharide biosynthesis tyrosine autokinase [Parerythrobacter jejuensis]MXP33866.1 polysaccharide biosynthesis tyrosine autokinase [Parerythrobacter jejuensis]
MNATVPPPETFEDAFADERGMPDFGIDLRRVWAAIYRHRFVFGGLVALVLAAAIVLTMITTPVFSARTAMQIDSDTSDVLEEETSFRSFDWDVERFLQTQIDVLLSRGTAMQLVEDMELARDDTFFDRMQVPAPVVPAPGKTLAETRQDSIARILQGNVDADLPRYSRILDLTFESPDAEYAAIISNAYAEAFIASNLERRFESSSYAREYLQEQLAGAKKALEDAERAQVEYARANNLVNLDGGSTGDETPLSLTQQTLINTNDALGNARNARIIAEERYRAARSGDPMQIPEVQTNGYIGQLQQELAMVEAQQGRDASRYKADHPVMQEYSRRTASLRNDLGKAVSDVRGSLRQQYQAALRNERQLQGNVNRLRSGTEAEQSRRVQFNILARETATNRDMYDALLSRFQEVSASAGVTNSNVSIIDRAETPLAPVRPQPFVNLALGLIAGLALGCLYVFLREFVDDAARTPEDITERFGLPFLGSVPKLTGTDEIGTSLDNPKSSVSEAFAALRTSLGLLGKDGLGDVLITSSQQSEGKSFVAYGIARSFAREGRKVLVVDADLRRPSQHSIFGVSRERGLTNILTRQIKPAEAATQVQENLDLIPSGPLPPSVPEFFSGPSFQEFRDWARANYDIVVFDGPPVMGLADTVLLAQKIEHLIFMVEAGRASQGRTAAAIRRLKTNEVTIDGAVLNKFDPHSAGYGYEYGYYYSYASETA